MKNILLGLLVGLFAFALPISAEEEAPAGLSITVDAEADIQFEKEYDLDIFNTDVDGELESQSYLVGADVNLGRSLTLTPKIGVWNSELEIAELVQLENEVDFACGLDAEYEIVEVYDGIILSMIGAYDFRKSEVEKVKILSTNLTIDNPIRNDLTIHSWEAGMKATFDVLPLNVVPYAALVYSDSNLNIDANLALINLDVDGEADDNLGLRLGVVGEPAEGWKIAVEGRLLDDTAVVASVRKRF